MKIPGVLSTGIPEGNPLLQYVAATSAMLAIITSGMHCGWPSPSLPKLEKMENSTLTITGDQGSWLAVMPLIGGLTGSLMVGATVDIIGRKRTIIFTSIPFITAWLMVAFGQSIIVLCIARFIAGLADGWSFTAVPMYIGEIADPKIRGLLGAGVQVAWIFGVLLMSVFGSYLSITTAALVSSVIPILTLVTFIWMPESPYYLLMKNQPADAKKSLQKFRGKPDVDTELDRMSNAIIAQTQNTGKFLDLFTTKSNRKAALIMMGLRGSQQFSGTIAIMFYSQMIFKEAGDEISSELASIIYFSVQFVLAFLGSSVVDRVGRRPLLIVSMAGSAIALFIEGIYFYIKTIPDIDTSSFSFVPVASLIGYVIIFSLGMQTIPILMMGELFPANVKAFALCLTDVYFCVVATIVSKLFQILKDSFGMYMPFMVFTISCIIGLIIILLFVPETKGKTLEEIQEELGGKIRIEQNETTNKSA